MSRQYHALTTHYNVYFNGKESMKEGVSKMEEAHKENYTDLLPIFEYEDKAARSALSGNMEKSIEKASKAIDMHSITRKPKRKKNKRSKKYKEFRQKREYNNWIDDCYLLLGKANFFKKEYYTADRSFKFMLKEYPKSKLRFEARLWLIKSMIEQEDYNLAFEQLVNLSSEEKLKRKLRSELSCVKANIYIKKRDFDLAIPELEQAVNSVNSKYKKARYRYLLAQLYQKTGQDEMAFETFGKLIKMNPSYEMTFNAKISRAGSFQGQGSGEKIRKELERMLRDSKNDEYQDQIYYALAEMDMNEGNTSEGVENYWTSTQKSVSNDNQKALSFLKLGEHYFTDLNYEKAQLCYDSVMIFLDQNYFDYERLSVLAKNLTELTTNLSIIKQEDSLQMVARMKPSERNNLIAGIIKKIEEDEQQKKVEQAEAAEDKAFFRQNDMQNRGSSSANAQGKWYFYNPTTIGIGKSDFERKWGKRKLEDNWRRKNKSALETSDIDEEEIAEDVKQQKSNKKLDPKTKEYYLADLPLNDSLINVSNKKIMKSLYKAGVVYEEKLDDEDKAIETLEELIRRFPETSYMLLTYYHCYIINKEEGNTARTQYYKEKITREFPDSDYAQALNDPNYYSKKEAENKEINRMYEKAYEDYTNYYYYRVIKTSDEVLRKYHYNDLKPSFLFLKALAIGRTEEVDNFRIALKQVLESEPTTEIKDMADGILAELSSGAIPAIYNSATMERARQIRLLRNWRFDDESQMDELQVDGVVETQSTYEFNQEEEHYFILLLPKKETKVNKVLFDISKYNIKNYVDREFKVEEQTFNKDKFMVVVKGLKNKSDALKYFNNIITNEKVFIGLEKLDYRNFLISASNLSVFIRNQDVTQYLNFYTKKYFNIDEKTSSVPIKKKGKLVIQKEEKPKFQLNPSDNHKFIIVMSSKLNINKLKADILNFDKDYEVLKEPYDDNNSMIIVNNLGTKREAMSYFEKITKSKIFTSMKNINYQSFVISNENFESFYVQKQLKQYIDFFTENYTKEQSDNKAEADEKATKDQIYAYSEETQHYFALIVSKKEVNIKKLEAAIRKYNTKNLETEVRSLDENRDIILVANMRNKKQAMMYFRAVVTNDDIFDILEKADYRNFVISQENLEILMKDAKITEYMNFFKGKYLQ